MLNLEPGTEQGLVTGEQEGQRPGSPGAQAGCPAAMTRALSGTGAHSLGGVEMSYPALKSQPVEEPGRCSDSSQDSPNSSLSQAISKGSSFLLPL